MNADRPSRSPAREELAQITRSRVMAALAGLLRAGEHDPTFEQVARASGVPQRTLYRHFATKDALYEAFWIWLNDGLDMPPSPTTRDELAGYAPALFAAFDRDPSLVRAMLHAPLAREVRLAHTGARREKFAAALREIPELPPTAERRLLAAVTALCSASVWEAMKDTCGLSGAEAADAARWAILTLIARAADEAGAQPAPDATQSNERGSPT